MRARRLALRMRCQCPTHRARAAMGASFASATSMTLSVIRRAASLPLRRISVCRRLHGNKGVTTNSLPGAPGSTRRDPRWSGRIPRPARSWRSWRIGMCGRTLAGRGRMGGSGASREAMAHRVNAQGRPPAHANPAPVQLQWSRNPSGPTGLCKSRRRKGRHNSFPVRNSLRLGNPRSPKGLHNSFEIGGRGAFVAGVDSRMPQKGASWKVLLANAAGNFPKFGNLYPAMGYVAATL